MGDDLNFDILTEQDKRHMSYGLCVLGTMAGGATLGSMVGGHTLLGAALGTVWGLFNCRYVAEPIKQRLFSDKGRLSDAELRQVLMGARRQFPLATKVQLLGVTANARLEAKKFSLKYHC